MPAVTEPLVFQRIAIELGERHAQLDTELMVALERWEMLGASA